MMSQGPLLLSAVVGCMLMSLCSGEFCDEGPPGRYCYENLTGYHACTYDEKTMKMVDTPHRCPSNTRCICFWGPACPKSMANPCAKYQSPPAFVGTFTLTYNATDTTCSGAGCHVSNYTGRVLQDLNDKRKRTDSTKDMYLHSSFVVPYNTSEWYEYQVDWAQRICSKSVVNEFPQEHIPEYFSYEGTAVIETHACEKWIWKTGGHNRGQSTTEQIYYAREAQEEKTNPERVKPEISKTVVSHLKESNFERVKRKEPNTGGEGKFIPVRIEYFRNSPEPIKESLHRVMQVVVFHQDVKSAELDPPELCH